MGAALCVFQFFMVDSWAAQLECIETTCFKGPDVSADLWLFWSLPNVMERFTSVLEATLNSRTGQAFTGGGVVDLGLSNLQNIFPSASTGACAKCMTCKFPELRALWFAVAVSVSLLNPQNFDQFYGDVTQKCLTNGSYYVDTLCGPRGAENFHFDRWRVLYADGHAEFDIDIVQAYAGLFEERSVQMGGAAAGEDAEMAHEAAKAWFFRDPTLPESEQAAQFYYLACRMWRRSDAGQELTDAPQRYADFAGGSLAYISTSWAYQTCVRAKQRVFGDLSRSVHSLALEVSMCLEDQVQCKKDEEECRGGCSGDLTSSLKCAWPR